MVAIGSAGKLRDGSEGGGAHAERFSTRAHRGERACRLVSPHPGSPPPGSRKHPPGSSRGLQRGVGTGTRTCFAGSDAARTPRCRDLSHSTAGLARSSPRERPGALMVDTAAAGGRRRQELWRFRYPSGAERGGRAAAQAPGKCPQFCLPTRRPRPSTSRLAGRPGLQESWVPSGLAPRGTLNEHWE